MNTGWTGGSYGIGERFSIPTTRAIIAAIKNKIDQDNVTKLEKLNLSIPNSIDGVDQNLLNPRIWSSVKIDQECEKLCSRFKENFQKYIVSEEIVAAGPQ